MVHVGHRDGKSLFRSPVHSLTPPYHHDSRLSYSYAHYRCFLPRKPLDCHPKLCRDFFFLQRSYGVAGCPQSKIRIAQGVFGETDTQVLQEARPEYEPCCGDKDAGVQVGKCFLRQAIFLSVIFPLGISLFVIFPAVIFPFEISLYAIFLSVIGCCSEHS